MGNLSNAANQNGTTNNLSLGPGYGNSPGGTNSQKTSSAGDWVIVPGGDTVSESAISGQTGREFNSGTSDFGGSTSDRVVGNSYSSNSLAEQARSRVQLQWLRSARCLQFNQLITTSRP